MICQHPACEASATQHLTSPFGSFDLCDTHSDEVCPSATLRPSDSSPHLMVGQNAGPLPDWMRE